MTDSPSEQATPQHALATQVAEAVGALGWSVDFGTIKVKVTPDRWAATLETARSEVGLDAFSWLSAIDWSRESAVGDGVESPESLEERFEVLCVLGTTRDNRLVVFSTDVPKDSAVIESVRGVFPGADWHERETHEMFGIDFRGHPHMVNLYLPDAFEGHPLRKDFPLLSREVKPWPGTVDVEGMPSDGEEEEPAGEEEGE